MRDLFNVMGDIKQTWQDLGRSDLVIGIESADEGASSGTEAAGMLMDYFRKVKRTDSIAFQSVELLVDEMINVYMGKYSLSYHM